MQFTSFLTAACFSISSCSHVYTHTHTHWTCLYTCVSQSGEASQFLRVYLIASLCTCECAHVCVFTYIHIYIHWTCIYIRASQSGEASQFQKIFRKIRGKYLHQVRWMLCGATIFIIILRAAKRPSTVFSNFWGLRNSFQRFLAPGYRLGNRWKSETDLHTYTVCSALLAQMGMYMHACMHTCIVCSALMAPRDPPCAKSGNRIHTYIPSDTYYIHTYIVCSAPMAPKNPPCAKLEQISGGATMIPMPTGVLRKMMRHW